MVPRVRENAQEKAQVVKVENAAAKKEEIKKLKKNNKLTFDLDEVEEGSRIKSSHEVLKDSKLSNEVAVNQQELARKAAEKAEEEEKKRTLKERIVQGEPEETGQKALMEQ